MKIFREEAIGASVNPENLDQAVVLINPKRWLGITMLVLLLVLSFALTYFIKIPIKVMGNGVVVNRSGVMELNVTAGADGYISKFLVKPGHKVKKNEIIALLDLKDYKDKLILLSTKLDVLKQKKQSTETFQHDEKDIQQSILESQRNILVNNALTTKKTTKWLSDLEKEETKLYKKGYYSYVQLLQRRIDIFGYNIKLLEIKTQIANLESSTQAAEIDNKREILTLDFEIRNLSSELETLNTQIEHYSKIKSPENGFVDELKVNPGELVSKGQTLLSITPTQDELQPSNANKTKRVNHYGKLEVVLYVPITEGKKIYTGLPVEIDPSTIQSSEYGKIMGVVSYVSSNVVSTEGMMRTLRNELLIKQLAEAGAVLEVKVKLLSDSKSYSGYKWTNSVGPNHKLTAGTYCTGEVIIKRMRLISILIPGLAPYFEKTTTLNQNNQQITLDQPTTQGRLSFNKR